jgi:ResB-like family protein
MPDYGNGQNIIGSLWRLSISPVTFVVLAILWCLDLGTGSLLAYSRPDLFGTLDSMPFTAWLRQEGPKALPHALWVHGLVILSWLMVISLLFCTANWFLFRRKRLKGLGEVLVHLGFLLVFAGYVIGAAFGARTLGVRLPISGGTVRVAEQDLQLTLREVRPLTGPYGEAAGTVSALTLTTPGGTSSDAGVRINHPLMAGATVVYPRGVSQEVQGARLQVGNATTELRSGRAQPLASGQTLELTAILQQDETRGDAQGPGIAVTIKDPAGRTAGTAYLSTNQEMPREAVIGGQRLALAELLGPFTANYDIHRDPGVRLVLVGALLICLGTLWALWGYLRDGN